MKKLMAMLLALLMALALTAMAEAMDYSEYIGKAYTGSDPWGGTLTVTVQDIRDGKMNWTYADALDSMTYSQAFEGTALTDGTAEFHVTSAADNMEYETFDYTGTIALKDNMVIVTYIDGEETEHSEYGGSTAYHVAALDEFSRVVALNPAPMTAAMAIDRFCDTWVDESAAVEIWHDGDFHCRATLEGNTVIEYERCHYDEQHGSLACEGGTRYYEAFDEATQTQSSEIVVTDLTADFELIDDGTKLIWNDSEGICKRFEFKRLSDAEEAEGQEAQSFVGTWGHYRCNIEITKGETDDFHVNVTWANSAAEQVVWDYDCVYDGATKQLHSYKPGVKKTVTWNEDGEIANTQVEYEDGEATFSIDANDMLTWNDHKENAAEDISFERGILIN